MSMAITEAARSPAGTLGAEVLAARRLAADDRLIRGWCHAHGHADDSVVA
jgi:hypothetical protein